MALRIGIVGAENSHTVNFAKTINVDKSLPGIAVEYVWGETPEFAAKAAELGRIPNIVRRPAEMLGKIDAVVVNHRHAKHHLPAARPFVEKGIPTFVDKPFCYRAKEGCEFLALARWRGTPVTSFSIMPLQRSFTQFAERLRKLGKIHAGVTCGPCDPRSPYGGIYFYGVHQVEMALRAFGYDVAAARAVRNANGAVGQLLYPSGLVASLHFIKEGRKSFGIVALGEPDIVYSNLARDKNPFLTALKIIVRMFRTRQEPLEHEEILKSVQVLEALEKSLRSSKAERVAK
ncbi:MAG: Gfo/Idh/MocA family oxidoreductase [Candidatus Sumerlaeota bacterium]|nr:Gfo/Idh/MocA family oxidoreductase [Candidatus Sumerlaeota bacterium]